jgi:hypothetical protein
MQIITQFSGSPRHHGARSPLTGQSRVTLGTMVDACKRKFRIIRGVPAEDGFQKSKLYKGDNNSRASLESNITLGETDTGKSTFNDQPSLEAGFIRINPNYRRTVNSKNDLIGKALYKSLVDESDLQSCNGNVHLTTIRYDETPAGKAHARRLFRFNDPVAANHMDDLLKQEKKAKESNNQKELERIHYDMQHDLALEDMVLPPEAIKHYRMLDQTAYIIEHPPSYQPLPPNDSNIQPSTPASKSTNPSPLRTNIATPSSSLPARPYAGSFISPESQNSLQNIFKTPRKP